MTACLVAESGFATSLQQKMVRVGSDPMAEIPFPDISGLAPFHFEITSTGQGHSVRQLQVASLLLVNGQPVTTARLVDGDVITAGALNLIYGSEVPESADRVPLPAHCDDEFVSRLTEAPPETRCLHLEEASEAPSLRAALLAAVVTLLITTIAYSFVCNFTWPFFIVGVLLLGITAGRIFRLTGDGLDARFGLCSALAVTAGFLTVNLLTVTGFMHMYENVDKSPAAQVGGLSSGETSVVDESSDGTLGTGRTAAEVTSLSLEEMWLKLIPWKLLSGEGSRPVPVTGFSAIMFGPKSLLALLLGMITAYRAAFDRRPKTTISSVAGGR